MNEPQSKPTCVAALDQGTTSTRCILFGRTGEILGVGQREHAQHYPQPGWVEHDAQEIWCNTLAVITDALALAGMSARDVAALGITNQRETTVLWDRHTGEPVHHALVWQDTRVEQQVQELARRGQFGGGAAGADGEVDAGGEAERIRALTGLPLASYFSALKLRWLLDNVPGARAAAERGDLLFGTMDSWVVWNLTGGAERGTGGGAGRSAGVHVTDVTNASRTQLMNLATLDWDESLLATFDIPRALLPRIVSSNGAIAETKVGALAGVPITGILGDQQAALVGQCCFEPGEVKNTYGTGCFMLMNTGATIQTSRAGLITTVAYRFGNEPACYALEGSVAIAGALVQWLRDNLGIIESSSQVEALARSVEDNGGVYFVPAFSGLYAPHWNAAARGAMLGLTRYATRAHIARAALEAVAFQVRELLEAMQHDAGNILRELRVDGGMVRNELLMQFQADMLGCDVVCPRVTETTALGAAYAAGLAVGYWRSRAELRRDWSVDRRWTPALGPQERSELYRHWHKAVGRSIDWVDT